MTQEPLFQLGTPPADGDGHHRAEPAGGPAAADPFTAAVPEWLAAELDRINPAGRSAYAALKPCARCGHPVLSGPNVQEGGVEDLTVDPAILTPDAELGVLLAGGYSAEVEPRRGRAPALFRRDRWLIRKPAGTRGRFTAPGHVCGTFPGVAAPWTMIFDMSNHHERNFNDCPPF